MADIPDGASEKVAAMAIAWEIVKKAFSGMASPADPKGGADGLLEVYEKAFHKIMALAE